MSDKRKKGSDLDFCIRLQNLLQAADPVRDEPEMPALDAQVMRRVVISAAGSASTRAAWRPAVWVAAAVALAIAVSISAGRWRPRDPALPAGGGASELADGARDTAMPRQLQFATPGGTRVIWVFDSGFKP